MSATTRRPRDRPTTRLTLTREQRRWIGVRDAIGAALDRHHLASAPPEVRALAGDVEQVLAGVDRELCV